MANDANSWEGLILTLEAVNRILKTKVEDRAKEIFKEHIQKDVYNAYTPKENGWVGHKTYERRHSLENFVTAIYPQPNEMVITSTAKPRKPVVKGSSFRNSFPGAFLALIEGDDHGIWRGGFSRPVVTKTQEDFDTNAEIQKLIDDGINDYFGIKK